MTPYVEDTDFTLYQGDALEVLRGLPDESVHCCVTSPPYWGLRDYGTAGQLGLEATPEEYVARMVEVFREVRRVLRADGTCWLNIGDSYASVPGGQTQGANGQMADRTVVKARAQVRDGKAASGMGAPQRPPGVTGLKPKDLVGIPWRLAFALQADGWYLRSDIIWSKPNPMPESVTDRPTKAHEYVFLLSKGPRYFFDQEAVRERWADERCGQPYPGVTGVAYDAPGQTPHSLARGPDGRRKTIVQGADGSLQHRNGERWPGTGRNVRSVWEIATEPYPDAHFATFPQALVERCIRAGTSERGCCPECGKPWERETEQAPNLHPGDSGRNDLQGLVQRGKRDDGKAIGTVMRERHQAGRDRTTLGWRPGCDHGAAPVPATVLDPFLGSGTTALVARRLGRHSIGIELSPDYCQLAARRLQQLSLLAEAT